MLSIHLYTSLYRDVLVGIIEMWNPRHSGNRGTTNSVCVRHVSRSITNAYLERYTWTLLTGRDWQTANVGQRQQRYVQCLLVFETSLKQYVHTDIVTPLKQKMVVPKQHIYWLSQSNTFIDSAKTLYLVTPLNNTFSDSANTQKKSPTSVK